MTGTLVNAVGVVLGGLLGLTLKKGLPPQLEKALLNVVSIATAIIGIAGVLAAMLRVENGRVATSGELLLLISMVAGALLGEWCRLDDRLHRFGQAIEKRMGAEGFSKGFVSASVLFCVGAMSIIGPLNDSLRGDASILFIKTALDTTMAIILTSTLGFGVLFSAVTILVYQGSISLAAGFISPFISPEMLNSVCLVGFAIVVCIGIAFLDIIKIKPVNLLPALLIPIAFHLTMQALPIT